MKKYHSSSYKSAQQVLLGFRKNQGLTQSQVAKRLGLDQSVISKIETGERRLDIVEFILYCNAIDVDPKVIIAKLSSSMETPVDEEN